MSPRSWLTGITVLAFVPALACAAEESDPLFAHFEGVWKNDVTLKTPAMPEGKKGTTTEVFQPALEGRYLIGREMGSAGSDKSLYLVRYDDAWNAYRWTIFNTTDLNGAEWSGRWDADTSTFKSKSSDCPANWTSAGINTFLTKDSVEGSAWMKDEKGNSIFEMSLTKTRQPAEVGEKMLAAWKAPADPKAELSPELQVLDWLAGTWNVTGVYNKAVWTPDDKTMKANVVGEWVLNRTFLQEVSKGEDGDVCMILFGYDPKHKVYRHWWFSSSGISSKSQGIWDAAMNTLTFESKLPEGQNSRGSMHFTDADHHEWKVLIYDANGKVYFDVTYTYVRAK